MTVVIVESPAKAKTINKYLGRDFQVFASFGHVRDLPPKDGSVRPDEDFAMDWEVDGKAQKRLSEIAAAIKGTDKLILATDPDREGEAISWHLLEILKKKGVLKGVDVERVVFNAITKTGVAHGMANPRAIDQELVDAYLARRALDYLVGFNLSPVLWRKLPGSRSAGRVQSVALRIICDREMEIEAFRPEEYWTVDADLLAAGGPFTARLTGLAGDKITQMSLKGAEAAARARTAIEAATLKVASVDSKPVKRNPYPPFITSSLQMEAARKLGFNAKRTMQVAQRLYEGVDLGGETVGLITYMRTDGVDLAPEAVMALRDMVKREYGDRYLPSSPRMYKSKAKNAQEAHEAIRPADPSRRPQDVARYLDADLARLYDLIWKRSMACQMEAAEFERTTVEIAGGEVTLRATGSVQLFDGFLTLYQEGSDDDSADEDSRRLPRLVPGETLKLEAVKTDQHFTEPPPRYSEASLVKKMEDLGIGRPSTYASTIAVLVERDYVTLDKKRFMPTDKGRVVTVFLKKFFAKYVEFDFTADLEEKLDEVSAGELNYKKLLRDFWTDFIAAIGETKELRITEVIDVLDEQLSPHLFPPKPDGSNPRLCPTCGTGTLGLRLGRFGAFLGCSNYPECGFTKPLAQNGAGDAAGGGGDRLLGLDDATGEEIWAKVGRFGPYVQRGKDAPRVPKPPKPKKGEKAVKAPKAEKVEEAPKPKRSSIPKGQSVADITLETAMRLLALPREVGLHPEDGKPIVAALGRFGPYISHAGVYANLESPEEVFTVGINRAVDMLAEKRAKGPSARFGAQALKELGNHPDDGAPVRVMKGRFGPYVTHGKVNANIPKDVEAEAMTLELAIPLLAARAPAKKGKAKAAPKKAAAKPAAKKPAAKKPAAKKTVKAKASAES
jgi:DNA topoisomerase-1